MESSDIDRVARFSQGYPLIVTLILESDKLALNHLIWHKMSNVRHWVKDHIAYIDPQIIEESKRYDEDSLRLY